MTIPYWTNLSPIVIIGDHNRNTIIDSSVQGCGLVSFSYTFNEEEADSCTIVIGAVTVEQFTRLAFMKGRALYVQWGYMGYLRSPIKILLTQVKEVYSSTGLTITLTGSDDFSVLNKASNPELVEALKFKSYLGRLSELGLFILAIKHREEGATSFYYPATQKVYDVKRITNELGITDDFDAVEDWIEVMSSAERKELEAANAKNKADYKDPMTRLRMANSSRDNHPTPMQGRGEGISGEYSKAGKRMRTQMRKVEIAALNAYVLEGPQEANKNFFGINDKTVVEGANPQEVVSNMLSTSTEGDWQVTGHGDKLVIHNRSHQALAVREYTFLAEPGTFLEFTYDSDSRYSEESVLKKLAVNPETGAITVKEYLTEAPAKEAETPFQFDKLSISMRHVKEILRMYEEGKFDPKYFALDVKALLGGEGWGISNDNLNIPQMAGYVNPQTPRYAQVTDASMDPTMGTGLAIDNAHNGLVPVYWTPNNALEEAQEAVDNVIKNLKTQGTGKRQKVSAKFLGDPYLQCTENISLRGLSKSRNGIYHITSCTHTLDKQGYTMGTEMYPISHFSDNVVTIEKEVESNTLQKAMVETKKEEKTKEERLAAGLNKYEYEYDGSIKDFPVNGQLQRLMDASGTTYKMTYTDKNKKRKMIFIKIKGDPYERLNHLTQSDLYRLIPDRNMNMQVQFERVP